MGKFEIGNQGISSPNAPKPRESCLRRCFNQLWRCFKKLFNTHQLNNHLFAARRKQVRIRRIQSFEELLEQSRKQKHPQPVVQSQFSYLISKTRKDIRKKKSQKQVVIIDKRDESNSKRAQNERKQQNSEQFGIKYQSHKKFISYLLHPPLYAKPNKENQFYVQQPINLQSNEQVLRQSRVSIEKQVKIIQDMKSIVEERKNKLIPRRRIKAKRIQKSAVLESLQAKVSILKERISCRQGKKSLAIPPESMCISGKSEKQVRIYNIDQIIRIAKKSQTLLSQDNQHLNPEIVPWNKQPEVQVKIQYIEPQYQQPAFNLKLSEDKSQKQKNIDEGLWQIKNQPLIENPFIKNVQTSSRLQLDRVMKNFEVELSSFTPYFDQKSEANSFGKPREKEKEFENQKQGNIRSASFYPSLNPTFNPFITNFPKPASTLFPPLTPSPFSIFSSTLNQNLQASSLFGNFEPQSSKSASKPQRKKKTNKQERIF